MEPMSTVINMCIALLSKGAKVNNKNIFKFISRSALFSDFMDL